MKALGNKKICSNCKVTKTIKEYYKDKGKTDGLSDKCIECARSLSKVGSSLSKLIEYSKIRVWKDAWTEKEANDLVKIYITSKKRLMKFQTALAEAKFTKSYVSCTQMIQELIKAGENKMTVRKYFNAGRPYKSGNKIIAKK